jgi:hypothetical protein
VSSSDNFFKKFVVYQNHNVPIHHPWCIMPSCIMLCYHHKLYDRQGEKIFKFVWTWGYHNSSCFQFHDYSTIGAKGHFRQGSKEQGPMKSSIPIGQEL